MLISRMTGRSSTLLTRGRSRSAGLVIGVAALAVGGFGLTACGSSGTAAQGGSSSSSGSAAAIKVGIAGVTSGPAVAYKQIIDGETAYFDMVNSSGGINGHKIDYKSFDTGYTADGVSRVVRQLATQGYAVVSGVASPAVKALVPYMGAQKKVVWVPFTDGGDLVPTVKNTFGVSAEYSRLGAADARFVSGLGAKNIGVLYEDDAVGQPGKAGVNAWLNDNGKPAATSMGFTNKDTDLSAQVARLKAANVDGVVFWGLAPQFSAFLQAASSANYHPVIDGFFGLASDATLKAAGAAAEGAYFGQTTTSAADCTDGYATFMAKDHPGEVTPLSEQGWSGGALIVQGIKNALKAGGQISTASLEQGLESINGQTIGCTPNVNLGSDNHIATTSEALLRNVNGSLVQVKGFQELPTVQVGR